MKEELTADAGINHAENEEPRSSSKWAGLRLAWCYTMEIVNKTLFNSSLLFVHIVLISFLPTLVFN